MVDIHIDDTEIKQLIGDVKGLRERDIPYVIATTANNLAFDALDTFKREVAGKLKISKKSIPSSWRVKKATKHSLEAIVFVEDSSWQHKVLVHHFYGGDRARKGLEKALIYAGLMLNDEILTESPGSRVSGSAYTRIMSQLKINYKAGYDANQTRHSRKRNAKRVKERYFVIPSYHHSHLSPGIYAVMPDVSHPVSILRIAKRPNYDKIFDMEKTVSTIYSRRANVHLGKAIDRALKLNAGWK